MEYKRVTNLLENSITLDDDAVKEIFENYSIIDKNINRR